MIAVVALYILYAVRTAFAGVSVANSLEDQLPNIARTEQPFSWTFSAHSFTSSTNSGLSYTANSLPKWLTFDPAARMLHGTPSNDDKGSPQVSITAHDGSSSASSTFTLLVTSKPAPTIRLPIEQQFYAGNPSLSSVFVLSNDSSLATGHPALRIPLSWSFSIGFQGKTFESDTNLYYDARQANGSPLPSWMTFNPKTITLNGVTPRQDMPLVVNLALHASDERGYTSSACPFDLVLASHEMYLGTSSLPTINITASTYFNISLTSPSDFAGVLIDGQPVQPSDVTQLDIDTSHYSSWMQYDESSRVLSGTPPSDVERLGPLLPVTIRAAWNQTIHTNVSLAVVPSYFSSSELDPYLTPKDGSVNFDLTRFYSDVGHRDDASLTAAFSPKSFGDTVRFDASTGKLSGTIPDHFDPLDPTHVTVTFTAFSHITHSTSHASLTIELPFADHSVTDTGVRHHKTGLSAQARARLIVGLGSTFGVIGGLVVLAGLLSLFRRYARVSDSALAGAAGERAWTEKDRQWYGVAESERGYGFSDEKTSLKEINGRHSFEPITTPTTAARRYGDIGLGIQRILRTPSSLGRSSPRTPVTESTTPPPLPPPGRPSGPRSAVMSKGEFLGKIKETVRVVSNNVRNVSNTIRKTSDSIRTVSDKYTKKPPRRPIIGKPVLIATDAKVDGLPNTSSPNPFDDAYGSNAAMTLSESPTASTEDRSIPKRRHDFTGVRSPMAPPTAVLNATFGRPSSSTSLGSEEYAAEAVIHTATRATSVKSGAQRTSLLSYQSLSESPGLGSARPRLVPFTSETRVPVPGSSSTGPSAGGPTVCGMAASRVPSQKAQVWKNTVADELNVSMHYVRALGGGESPRLANSPVQSTHTVSTNNNTDALTRSSFSSLAESSESEQSHETTGSGRPTATLKRMLVRTGEKFKFKVKVMSGSGPSVAEVKLLSGRPLPGFLKVDMRTVGVKGSVEFCGVPGKEDVGEMINVGVYAADGKCVARLILEVSEKKV